MVKQSVLDESGKMSAAHIGVAARGDVTMRPPERPCVVGGLRTERIDDGVLITGGPKPVFLSGQFARTGLLPLLEHLDGRRDIEELSSATGLSPQNLETALALLHAKRLLQWGPVETGHTSSQVALALSARLANSRYFKNPAEALDHGRANPVRVVGEDPLIELDGLAEQLHATGLRLADGEESLGRDSLILLVGDGADHDVNAMREQGHVVVQAYTQSGLLVLSSLIRDDLPCHECFQAAMQQAGGPEIESLHAGDRAMREVTASRIATALLAGNVITIALRTAQLKLIRRAVVIDLAEGGERLIEVHARPGCAHCGAVPAPAEDTALIYEDQVAFPPADLLDPATHLTHYKPANVELQRPEPSLAQTHLSIGEHDVDDDAVRRLFQTLRLAFGFKPDSMPGQHLRYAPTGGNLGSPQCDVLVGDGVPGIDPAHYRYESASQRLVRISDCVVDVPQGSVRIVLSAGLARMGSKYGANALRLVHLDAGVTRGQLLAAAVGHGFQPQLHLRSDTEELQRQIRRPRKSDPITCMVSFQVRDDRQHTSTMASSGRKADGEASGAGRPENAGRPEDTGRPEETEEPAESPGVLDTLLRFAEDGTDTAATHAVGTAFASLDAGIPDRSSHRMWEPRPVGPDVVSRIASRIMDARNELAQGAPSPRTDFAVIGQRVEGTSPRSWDITAEGSLELITPLEDQPLADAVIQPEYSLAPVLVVATVRLAELSRWGGSRAYLDALMEAGTGLHAGWLEMRRHGLEGGVFAGILPDNSVKRLLNGSLWDRRPVLALAMGHPLPGQEEQS